MKGMPKMTQSKIGKMIRVEDQSCHSCKNKEILHAKECHDEKPKKKEKDDSCADTGHLKHCGMDLVPLNCD